jgi:hypothetical protein
VTDCKAHRIRRRNCGGPWRSGQIRATRGSGAIRSTGSTSRTGRLPLETAAKMDGADRGAGETGRRDGPPDGSRSRAAATTR